MATRKKRRRRRGRRESSGPLLILASVLATAAIAISGISYFALTTTSFDPKTACFEGVAPTRTSVMIIDQSDAFSPLQAEDLRTVLRDTFDNLRPNEPLSIYLISGEIRSIPRPRKTFCRPPLRTDTGPEMEGVRGVERFLERGYNDFFEKQLKPIIEEVTKPNSANISPIMEWVAAISRQENLAADWASKNLILFSDMVQFVPREGFEVCGRFPSFNSLPDRYQRVVAADLTGVNVTIYGVRRFTVGPNGEGRCAVAVHRSLSALEDFWFEYFAAAQAQVVPGHFITIRE